MKITFKLFAALQDYLPEDAKKSNALAVEVLEGTTIDAIIDRFNLPKQLCHLVLIDGHFVPPDARKVQSLREGQTLSIWPPVAGG